MRLPCLLVSKVEITPITTSKLTIQELSPHEALRCTFAIYTKIASCCTVLVVYMEIQNLCLSDVHVWSWVDTCPQPREGCALQSINIQVG